MKIAIVTDTHFGLRGDSEAFDNAARRFFTDQFFPYLEEHDIQEVFHLGDLFDRRKFVNYQTLHNCFEYFNGPVSDYGLRIIPGNHDVYYKNTNRVNAIHLLLGSDYDYDSKYVIFTPKELVMGGRKIAMIPWVTEDNREETLKFLEKTDATVCMGHFDIVGFKMTNGQVCEHGFDASMFSKFDLVLSGHFHHKSHKGNIHYLGCPYEQTWDDFGSDKGFHVLDTDTLELEFIKNPNVMHKKIHYDDSQDQKIDAKQYKGCMVKIVVVNKTDYKKFDALVEKLYVAGVLDLKIIEDLIDLEGLTSDDTEVNLEDTASILSDYIDDADISLEKSRLKVLMRTLYIEAQNVENI